MQLWPLAMLISQSVGGDAHRETMREMLEGGVQRGSVLYTFGLLATSSHDRVASSLQGPAAPTPGLACTAYDAAAPVAPGAFLPGPPSAFPPHAGNGAQPYAPGSQPPNGVNAHSGMDHRREGRATWTPAGDTWPRTLLMMAANRTPGDAPALSGLGDHLWTLDRPHARAYAHVCYILAGRPVDAIPSQDSKFAAPGVDHHACVGGVGTADALQRTELLAWCMSQSQGLPMYWLAPSYLQVRSLLCVAPSCSTPMPCACALQCSPQCHL